MLTSAGIDALVAFDNESKMESIIVTRAMTSEQLAWLEKLLLKWAADKTPENEKKIIDEFSSKAPPGADL